MIDRQPKRGEGLYAAAMRHLTDWYEGKKVDQQWGLPTLAHCACCILFPDVV